MADEKKPKDLAALKARLKGTKQAPGKAAPVVLPPGGVVPPPGGVVPPPGGVVPPPGGAAPPGGVVPPPAGVVAKPGAVPVPAALAKGAGIAPPPFARPKAPAGPDLSRDPFAMSRGGGAGEVRLVIDEKVVVDEKETGRGRRLGLFVTLAVAFATLSVGYCGGNAMKDRIIFNRSVRDAREIKSTVESCAKTLAGAQARIQGAINLANSKKQADLESVEYLRSLKKPIDAGAFSRRNYIAFESSMVDNLFEYYNGINVLFDTFGTHVARSLADRDALTKSAATIQELSENDYAMGFTLAEGQLYGMLAIMEFTEDLPPGKCLLRARPGSPTAERSIFNVPQEASEEGSNCITEDNYRDLAIPLDPQNKSGLLACTVDPFRDYVGRLASINQQIQTLTQLQGQLMTSLSDLANLEDLATIGE